MNYSMKSLCPQWPIYLYKQYTLARDSGHVGKQNKFVYLLTVTLPNGSEEIQTTDAINIIYYFINIFHITFKWHYLEYIMRIRIYVY